MAEDAAAYCAAAVRQHDRERWLGALFAPDAKRARLIALYAFNLEIARVPEAVREPQMGLIRLQWWRDALGELRAGHAREHPVCRALAAAGAATWPAGSFETLLTARERDLDEAPFADLAALERHADGTSGELGALALAALGVDDPAARAAARAVGRAWALTGMLRAAAFHAARGRRVLPAGDAAPVAARARTLLAEARARAADPRAFPVTGLAVLAERHLARIARAGHDPFHPQVAAPLPLAPLHLALARLRGRW